MLNVEFQVLGTQGKPTSATFSRFAARSQGATTPLRTWADAIGVEKAQSIIFATPGYKVRQGEH